MSLSEGTARKIVLALQHAATTAKNNARTEETNAAYAISHPPQPMPPNDTISAYMARQYQRSQSAKMAQLSITDIAKILEGVVYLAAGQHMSGVSRLEGAIDTSNTTLGNSNPRQTEVYLAHEALKNQDLPALSQHNRVKPGLLNRLYKGEIKYSHGAPYAREMLEVISVVKNEIATALETTAVPAHR